MKLTNHRKNNYGNDVYGNVIAGTITMSQQEYADVYQYLSTVYGKAKRENNTYCRDSLAHLFSTDFLVSTRNIFSVGVMATKLIALHYHLPKYKDQNYIIKLTR